MQVLHARPLLHEGLRRAPALLRWNLLHLDEPRLTKPVRRVPARELLYHGQHRAVELRARLILNRLLARQHSAECTAGFAVAATSLGGPYPGSASASSSAACHG